MKKVIAFALFSIVSIESFCWGFYAHQKINYYAVFLLPPAMLVLYKPNIQYLSDHAVDPDKRRYAVAEEAPKHYIDLDNYGRYPYDKLPRRYADAVAKYGADTIQSNGIVPWHIAVMQQRLTEAFKEKNKLKILKISAEIGHYIADSHVPLHASANHDGQHTNQKGIHGFWESRIPELLSDKEFDFVIGKAVYISNISSYIWDRVIESGAAADTVLQLEAQLTASFGTDKKYAFEERNGKIVRQYAEAFTRAYHKLLNGMVERRMRLSITSVASFWYTAWVNAGQPDLSSLQGNMTVNDGDKDDWDQLNAAWKSNTIKGREHE